MPADQEIVATFIQPTTFNVVTGIASGTDETTVTITTTNATGTAIGIGTVEYILANAATPRYRKYYFNC